MTDHESIRYCQDCKHCKPDLSFTIFTLGCGTSRWKYATCKIAQEFGNDDLVYRRKSSLIYCSVERRYDYPDGSCGSTGRNFEPR